MQTAIRRSIRQQTLWCTNKLVSRRHIRSDHFVNKRMGDSVQVKMPVCPRSIVVFPSITRSLRISRPFLICRDLLLAEAVHRIQFCGSAFTSSDVLYAASCSTLGCPSNVVPRWLSCRRSKQIAYYTSQERKLQSERSSEPWNLRE